MKGTGQIQDRRVIPLVLTQALDRDIRKAAKDETLSVSAWIRQAALSQLRQKAKENAAA